MTVFKPIIELLTIVLFLAGGYVFAQLGADHVLEARNSNPITYTEVTK